MITMFKFYQNKFIVSMADLHIPILATNDNETGVGFTDEINELFNPCLSLQSIIKSQREIIADAGVMFGMLSEILRDRKLIERLPEMAQRCEDFSRILGWNYEEAK